MAKILDNDDELLGALSQGEAHAVALIYQRHGSRMVAFARRYIGDEGSAEDVVATLLQRWLERPPKLREVEQIHAFLATSVYHAAVDWIRRDRTERGKSPRAEPDPAFRDGRRRSSVSELAAPASRERLSSRLTTALDQLTPGDRLLLETHYGQALTPEECMHLLRITRPAFHQRLHRARSRLARLLSAADAPAAPKEEG